MKKLQRRKIRFKGWTIGLDLHKKFIQYSVIDRRGNEIANARIQPSAAELRKLHAKYSPESTQFALEACGTFVWVYDELIALAGRENVHVANPSKMASIGKSEEKSDATDAYWLAYHLYEGTLPKAHVSEGTVRDLKIAGRELRSWTDIRSDLLRRFKSHLAQCGLQLPKAWHTSEVKRKLAREAMRKTSGSRRGALLALYTAIERLGKMVRYWLKELTRLSAQLPDVAAIDANVAGLGAMTSAIAYAEVGDPRRFRSAKAYAKATGLTPANRDSGGKKVERPQITRCGSRHARWAFTRAVVACLRCSQGAGAHVRKWVEDRARRKPKKSVMVAAARKLAEAVWRLFALGEVFDLKRAFPVKLGAPG